MQINRTQFSFFGRREVKALYGTLALITFGEGLINIFVPIFLWKMGFAIWQILFFYFLHSVYFVILTFATLPILDRMSDKMMMFLSVPLMILYFFGLNYIAEIPYLFLILPLILALNTLFFDVGYNLDFSQTVDDKKIGREIGTRNTISALVHFSAPFIGGALIVFYGFSVAFFIASLILFGAVVPLFFFPHRHLATNLKRGQILRFLFGRGIQNFNISGIGYSTELIIGGLLWPMFIFFAVNNIESLGGIISVGLFASAITTYFVGLLSDSGDRRKILSITTILFATIWATRIFTTSPNAIIISNVIGNIIAAALMVAWSSQFYKIAKAVTHPSLFILSREVLYFLSRIVFLPILMFLSCVLTIQNFFMVSFGLAALLQLLFLFANRFHLNDLTAMNE